MSVENKQLPKHVAIIMDGNRRWAKKSTLPSVFGHKKGYEVFKEAGNWCLARGIKYLTVYAFSTENWQRSKKEVSYLFSLLQFALEKEIDDLNKKGVRFQVAGRINELPTKLQAAIKKAIDLTKHNAKAIFTLAVNYGGRAEITDAVEYLLEKYPRVKKITEKMLGEFLYNPAVPPPDLIIRTSGEQRLSGFLLWQSAYSELFFTPKLWPDFSENDLDAALEEYANRKRRYGK